MDNVNIEMKRIIDCKSANKDAGDSPALRFSQEAFDSAITAAQGAAGIRIATGDIKHDLCSATKDGIEIGEAGGAGIGTAHGVKAGLEHSAVSAAVSGAEAGASVRNVASKKFDVAAAAEAAVDAAATGRSKPSHSETHSAKNFDGIRKIDGGLQYDPNSPFAHLKDFLNPAKHAGEKLGKLAAKAFINLPSVEKEK